MEELKPVELQSVIDGVTVFADRALVSRKASLSLPKGPHRLVFADLPEGMEESSVQVSGSGGGLLTDIRLKQVFYTDMPDSEKQLLVKEKLRIEDELKVIEDTANRKKQEKQFLAGIVGRITGVTEQSPPGELDPDKWIKMISFYAEQLEALDLSLQALDIKKRELLAALQAVAAQLSLAGEAREWVKRQVEVFLSADAEGEFGLTLSYIVHGPSWKPVYNLRVNGDESKMAVEYNAMVRQNTLEDWMGVELKLSTANPQISGTAPELSPWFVDIAKPVPPPMVRTAPAPASESVRKKAKRKDGDFEEEETAPNEMLSAPPALEQSFAEVSTGAASVVFAIPGRCDIKSDNADCRVSIAKMDFKAEFTYESVPKLSQYAYLAAKVVNESDYPFLPGDAYIYLDGCFVAVSGFEFIAPGQEFLPLLAWTRR